MSNDRPFVDRKMFLGMHPLFSGIDGESLNDLIMLCGERRYDRHGVIVVQGEPGDEMFFIEKGRVRVSLDIGNDEPVVLGFLGAGEGFGELALFDRMHRSATVSAVEATVLRVVGRDAFLAYLEQRPQVAIRMLGNLSRRLRSVSDVVRESLYLDASARLGDLLREMARAYGKHTRKGLLIDAPFSEEELGDIAGLPQAVVHAQLRQWHDEGIIAQRRGRITILQPELLTTHGPH